MHLPGNNKSFFCEYTLTSGGLPDASARLCERSAARPPDGLYAFSAVTSYQLFLILLLVRGMSPRTTTSLGILVQNSHFSWQKIDTFVPLSLGAFEDGGATSLWSGSTLEALNPDFNSKASFLPTQLKYKANCLSVSAGRGTLLNEQVLSGCIRRAESDSSDIRHWIRATVS